MKLGDGLPLLNVICIYIVYVVVVKIFFVVLNAINFTSTAELSLLSGELEAIIVQ